jgi:hypothetical protein
MSLFNQCFNTAMAAFSRVAGEMFTLGGASLEAISIEELTVETRAMLGGKFRDARSRMLLSAEVVALSGIKNGSIVKVRGEDLRVSAEPEQDGTGSLWIALGPVGVDIPRR